MLDLTEYPKPTLAPRQKAGLATINGDQDAKAEALRDYYAIAIENCIAKNLGKIPVALTAEQKAQIVALLDYDPATIV